MTKTTASTTPTTPDQAPEALVREQVVILSALATLSSTQRDAAAARDADAMDRILDERQTLIERLTVIASELTRRSADLTRIASGGGERGAAITRDLAESARVWSALASSDAETLADLRRQRDALSRELTDLGKSGRAAGAYHASTGGSLFQDTEA